MERKIWGFLLILMGVAALLQGTGFYFFGLAFWPVVLVLLGIGLIRLAAVRWSASWLMLGLGLWVAGIGLFDILFNAGVTALKGADITRHAWPVLLVALGVSIMFGRRARFFKGHCRGFHGGHGSCGHHLRVGDLYQGREPWMLDGDLDLRHSMGDAVLDLTTAEISGGEHNINVRMAIGDLLIRVPDHVSALLDASVAIGSLQVLDEQRSGIGGLSLRREISIEGAAAVLNIKAGLGIGELNIVRAPAYPGGIR